MNWKKLSKKFFLKRYQMEMEEKEVLPEKQYGLVKGKSAQTQELFDVVAKKYVNYV